MKNRAIVTGIKGVFDSACVMLTSLCMNMKTEYDLIVYEQGLSDIEKEILKHVFGAKQVTLYAGIAHNPEDPCIRQYSDMAFSKYECLNLLDDYEQVLWLDTDLLLRYPGSESIFEYTSGFCFVRKETVSLASHFLHGVPSLKYVRGFPTEKAFNSGVLLFNDNIKSTWEIYEWCLSFTREQLAEQGLRYADQGVWNLIPNLFDVATNDIGLTYNFSIGFEENCHNPLIHHFYTPYKPWTDLPGANTWHGSFYVDEWLKWREMSKALIRARGFDI